MCRFIARFFTIIAILSLSFHSYGQDGTVRSWTGRVVDTEGDAIAGARIAATLEGHPSDIRRFISDRYGSFSLVLDSQSWHVEIGREGFVSQQLSYSAGQLTSAGNDIVLQIAPIDESVTVTESLYKITETASATRTRTPLIDTPQSITVVTRELMRDQLMSSMGDVVRYVPGIQSHQGENNRDQVIIRGNSTSADFYVNGVRDDVQYYRDLYSLERVEALKGPNAMIFGRGGGGGVINRVVKEPFEMPLGEISLQGGSFGNKRAAGDWNRPLGAKAAIRGNMMYEDTNTFRNNVGLNRYGISPTFLWNPGKQTKLVFGYERFHDARVADRGISSFNNQPLDVPVRTFFGDPKQSPVRADVNMGAVTVEHQMGLMNVRNRAQFAGYGRFYQNFVPGAVTADKLLVSLSSYNNATNRLNLFNQTDVSYVHSAGRIRQTLLGGMEIGRQYTDNFRSTGYFNNTATTLNAPVSNPSISAPITYRQSATDADNHIRTAVGAGYVQDQLELTRYLRVVAGLRFDRFSLNYHNNRNGDNLQRIDNLLSPRLGLIFKPKANVSAYGNYSVSYLPSSGDQFASLTTITQQVKPEKFTNYEVGMKWDLQRAISLTAAAYRLNRTNTRSTDPNDATRIVQTGSTRTNGVELGVNGTLTRKWRMVGGYAYQDAFISSATTAARAGAVVAQVPRHTFSLWNNYQVVRRVGAGVGLVNRAEMFAAIDNTVRLPGYTRVDAAVFVSLTEKIRLQGNVENLANSRYYSNADNNTNISPGSPRAAKVALTVRF
jgi:catecholate siderophore receptor